MRLLLMGHAPYLPELLNKLSESVFDQHEVRLALIPEFAPRVKKQSIIGKARRVTLYKLLLRLNLVWKKPHKVIAEFRMNSGLKYEIPKGLQHLQLERNPFQDTSIFSEFDWIIVTTLGRRIRKSELVLPQGGFLNIHPSPLPELRGGYPMLIQCLSNEFKLGTTLHRMNDKFDEGQIIDQTIRTNKLDKTQAQLLQQSALDAASLIEDFLKNPQATFKEQEGKTSHCRSVFNPKWYLKELDGTFSLDQLCRSYYIPSMFPFIYTFRYGFLFQILEVMLVGNSSAAKGKLSKRKGQYYVHMWGKKYQVIKYIYCGKLNQVKTNN